MIVYKAAHRSDTNRPCIVVLDIPHGAKMRLGNTAESKCRVEKAKVVRLETMKGEIIMDASVSAYANFDTSFKYKVGKIVRPEEKFNTGPSECSSGIHFFFVRAAAVRWAKGW